MATRVLSLAPGIRLTKEVVSILEAASVALGAPEVRVMADKSIALYVEDTTVYDHDLGRWRRRV